MVLLEVVEEEEVEVAVEAEVAEVVLLGPLDLLGLLHLLGPRFPMQTYQHKICHLHKLSK